mgnify:CR=1 FL=1
MIPTMPDSRSTMGQHALLAEDPVLDQGIYVLCIRLREPVNLRAGALPERRYSSGIYWYVGSAQRHLRSRLRRHLRTDKPLRWHVDHFLILPETRIEAVFVKPADKSQECATARNLSRHGDAVPRFGASDCPCLSHLIHTREDTARTAEEALQERGFTRIPCAVPETDRDNRP